MPRLPIRLLPTLLAAYGVAILGVTLYPFRVSPDLSRFSMHQLLAWPDTGFWEPLGNVLLFVPLAALLAAWRAWPRPASWRQASFVVGVCVVASAGIEGLQILLPERTTNVKDVTLNGLGGALGVLAYQMTWALLAPHARTYSAHLTRWFGGTYVAILLSTVTLGYLPYTWSLSSWNPAYPLVLGAEVPGALSWRGTVADLMLSDQALSDADIRRTLQPAAPQTALLMAWYPLRCDSLCLDQTGTMPPLVLWSRNRSLTGTSTVQLRRRQGLRTSVPLDSAITALRATSQFTLALTLTPHATIQRGPAPLLALAPDITRRNLLIGQERRALHLLLRSPANGPRADRVVFVVPGFFEKDATRRFALRYDGRALLLRTRERPATYRLRITPEVATLWWTAYAFGPYHVNLAGDDLAPVAYLYYLLAFAPLGLLFAAWVRARNRHRVRLALAGLLLLPWLLQGVIYLAGGEWATSNVLLSMGALGAGLGLGLLLGWLGDRRRAYFQQVP